MTAEWPEHEPAGTVELERETEEDRPVGSRWAGLPTLALIPLAAVVWWVAGFLPWIVGGLRFSEFSETHTALPLIAGGMSTLVTGSGIGGLAGGLVSLLGRGGRGRSIAAATAGVIVSVAVTLVQSIVAVRDPSPDNFSTADRVLTGLTLVVVATSVVGVLWGLLALTGPVGQGLALVGLAGGAPAWMLDLLDTLGLYPQTELLHGNEVARWFGATLLAAGLFRIGVRPPARLLWWIVGLALAWCVGPTITASVYVEQILRPGTTSSEIFDFHVPAAWDVWKAAASLDGRPLTPWIVAIVVAVVLAVILDRVLTQREEQSTA